MPYWENPRAPKRVILRTSVISDRIPEVEVSVSDQAAPIVSVPVLTSGEVSG